MKIDLLKISPIAEQTDNLAQLIVSEKLNMSLPFLMNCLIVCDDHDFGQQIADCLRDVNNFIVKIEPKISLIDTDMQLLILVYTGDEQQIYLDMEKALEQKIPVLLTGDISPTIMRKAIQYQINDFIPLEYFSEEIGPALLRLSEQILADMKMAPVVSIINGKGGSGASFITDCIGQICAQETNEQIVLFDADFQHGSLADTLDVHPEYYLNDALKDVYELDALAIKSMMCVHNNLSLLPVRPYSHLSELAEINHRDLSLLVNKIRQSFQLVIADVSRGLDVYSLPILDISDVILVVVQQNIVSIREAKALVSQMRDRMGIKAERIHLIVNRFSKKHGGISVAEIKEAVGINSALTIQNNYELASASTDLAKPLLQMQNSKQIRKDIEKIISNFLPISINQNGQSSGFWSRFPFNSNKE